MTIGADLLRAVIDEPDDDGPRLVYADWLDEHGDPDRAEFIRLQCEIERLKKSAPNRDALLERERKLLAQYGKQWLRGLPDWVVPTQQLNATERDWKLYYRGDWDWHGFKRGFLNGISVGTAAQFVKHAPRVFKAQPITHLCVGLDKGLDALAGSPQFLRLRGLRFPHYTLGDRGVVELAKLPPPPHLRHLYLYKNVIGDRGLRALANWPGLASVRELDLGFNYFHATGVRALIASRHLKRLKRLYMEDSAETDRTKQLLKAHFGRVVVV